MLPYLYLLIIYLLSARGLVKRLSNKRWIYPAVLVGYVLLAYWSVFITGAMFFEILTLWCIAIFLGSPILLGTLFFYARKQFKILAPLSLLSLIVVAGTGAYAFVIEPLNLEIRREKIVSPKISSPVRLAILADIQTDNVGFFESLLFQKVMEEKPDLIVFPGDYIQSFPDQRDEQIHRLNQVMKEAKLSAPLGIYAVDGDQDQYDGWEKIFSGLQVKTFSKSETTNLPEISITALSRHDSELAEYKIPEDRRFQIVFGHMPEFSMKIKKGDLLIAGHTHGGQVQFPGQGPLLTYSKIPRDLAGGCFETVGKDRYLIVSRGIGMERGGAPRLRFFCRPEIVIVDIIPK